MFAVDFPHRTSADGRTVVSHAAFVRYLVAKVSIGHAIDISHFARTHHTPHRATVVCKRLCAQAPDRIGIAHLPFEGKNVVVYSLPQAATEGPSAGQCEPCAD